MKTIQTTVVVEPGHTTTLHLPEDIEPGRYQVTLVIDDQPIRPKSDLKDFPVIDVGPWPEGLSLRREDIYDDQAVETTRPASSTLIDVFDARGRDMAEGRPEPLPESPIVPLEYAGLWIAWDRTLTRIVASGSSLDEAHDAAVAAGEPRPVLGKAPRGDIFFVGAKL